MGTVGPKQLEEDSRGILDPGLLRQRVHFTRYPVSPTLAGLIDHFWAVTWNLPAGTTHTQKLLTHPGCNLSIGHADARGGDDGDGKIEARLNGVARKLTTRTLKGGGWTVAALTTPGGLGAFVVDATSVFTGHIVPLGSALDLDEENLIKSIVAQPDELSRVKALECVLEDLIELADTQKVHQAREVAQVARRVEIDRSLRRLSDVSNQVGIGPRTLQRMFLQYVGVSPTWVLRRYRLLDAAEAVKEGKPLSWSAVAADLGFADQAHLSREFRSAIGETPTAYAELQAEIGSSRTRSSNPNDSEADSATLHSDEWPDHRAFSQSHRL
jgi:AraC-like DNA-binding protein